METKDITIYNESCFDTMNRMDEGMVDLTVTSPPYNVGINYDNHNDSVSEKEYSEFMSVVARKLIKVTAKGGRLCLNVPFVGNSYFLSKSQHLQFYPLLYVNIFQEAGWIFRDFVIWVKTQQPENPNIFCGDSTQWGSWMSPSCPYLRCYAEAILLFHKETKTLQKKGIADITREEFLEFTKNVWYFPAETNRMHPAPFPVELPYRCIKLYTYRDALVYDPFMGSGTTAIACLKTGRRFIGSEISETYVKMAKNRIYDERLLMSQGELYVS